jgi:superfamily II DNA or RNA helicase
MPVTKAILKDGLYVPIRFVSPTQLEKVRRRYSFDFYDKEQICEKCEYFELRPCETCANCPNYHGRVNTWRRHETKEGKEFLRLPFGDIAGAERIFGRLKIADKRPEVPMKRRIKFTGGFDDGREFQIKAIRAMIDQQYGGVLKSAPRTGKTVMAAAYVCELGLKTVIMAAQQEWLDGFYETFAGSETQEALTNVSKKRIGFPKTMEQVDQYDICLFTYQTFLSPKGRKFFERIKNKFSVLIVDEVQTAGAEELGRIVSNLNVKYKIGLSGTPERKDSKERVIYKLFGPIFHQTKAKRLQPQIQCRFTNITSKVKLPQTWPYIVRRFEEDPVRLKQIAKEALKDVKAGHSILIPFHRTAPIKALAEAINKMAGRRIAVSFYGGSKKADRKTYVQQAREYKIKVVVGQFRLLSTGLNIPRASMLYEVTLSSNPPKAEQRFARVLTPYEGKPQPVIKYFLDDQQVRRSCISAEYWKVMHPQFRPMFDPATKELFFKYLGKKRERWSSVNDYTGGRI